MKNNAAAVDMEIANFSPINTFVTAVEIEGKKALRVTKDPKIQEVDDATYARWIGSDFRNGSIEVQVLSRLLPDAPDYARGFIGVAFRMDVRNAQFEGIYIRPTNGRAEDPFRRAHATQYFSYPDFKFDRLRKEAPGQYESGADIGLNEWIHLKIEVKGEQAVLYLNGSAQPVLSVNDLKHGPYSSGAIGLWVDVGTEGYFTGLRVANE